MLVSVIIPVVNEAATIARTLASLAAVRGDKEVIVVDGGSTDGTQAQVQASGCLLVSAPRGRARQMNAGSAYATGEILLFLHSDSLLDLDALEKLEAALKEPAVVGGGFRLAMDMPSPVLNLVCFLSNLRACLAQVYFGDQGIFVRRGVFAAAGGFPDIEIMEDWELSRRLVKLGKLRQAAATITTFSRRFRRGGVWRTIWLMQKLKFLYLCGVPPAAIKAYYQDVR